MAATFASACTAALDALRRFEGSYGIPVIDGGAENAEWFWISKHFPGWEEGIEGMPTVLVSKSTGEAVLMWPPQDPDLYLSRTADMVAVSELIPGSGSVSR